jgi:beta-phosphoglucomutase family hydrolase
MLKAVIFDMDGVIVNTELIHSEAFENILSEYGVTPEKNMHGTVHEAGKTTPEVWEDLKIKYDFEASTEELTAKKRDVMTTVINKGLEPLPGLIELLKELSNHTILLAVASSAQENRIVTILEMVGIAKYFKVIISADDVEQRKPAPEPYEKAARLLGVEPADCVVIEDTEIGITSAKAAGMKAIAVPNEYTKRMDFDKADKVVSSLEDISYDLLLNL